MDTPQLLKLDPDCVVFKNIFYLGKQALTKKQLKALIKELEYVLTQLKD